MGGGLINLIYLVRIYTQPRRPQGAFRSVHFHRTYKQKDRSSVHNERRLNRGTTPRDQCHMTSVTFHLTLPLVKICGSVGQLSATGYSQGTLKADSVFSWALKNSARVSPNVLISISSVVKI